MKIKLIVASCLMSVSLGAMSTVTGLTRDGVAIRPIRGGDAIQSLTDKGWSQAKASEFVHLGGAINNPSGRDERIAFLSRRENLGLPGNETGAAILTGRAAAARQNLVAQPPQFTPAEAQNLKTWNDQARDLEQNRMPFTISDENHKAMAEFITAYNLVERFHENQEWQKARKLRSAINNPDTLIGVLGKLRSDLESFLGENPQDSFTKLQLRYLNEFQTQIDKEGQDAFLKIWDVPGGPDFYFWAHYNVIREANQLISQKGYDREQALKKIKLRLRQGADNPWKQEKMRAVVDLLEEMGLVDSLPAGLPSKRAERDIVPVSMDMSPEKQKERRDAAAQRSKGNARAIRGARQIRAEQQRLAMRQDISERRQQKRRQLISEQ